MMDYSPAISKMMLKFPQLYLAKKLAVGPDYTIEFRADLNRWEVMQGTAHVRLHQYIEDAFETVIDLDPRVTLPQDVRVLS